jgi:hypothetical protein
LLYFLLLKYDFTEEQTITIFTAANGRRKMVPGFWWGIAAHGGYSP